MTVIRSMKTLIARGFLKASEKNTSRSLLEFTMGQLILDHQYAKDKAENRNINQAELPLLIENSDNTALPDYPQPQESDTNLVSQCYQQTPIWYHSVTTYKKELNYNKKQRASSPARTDLIDQKKPKTFLHPIPINFEPDQQAIDRSISLGYSEATFKIKLDKFINYYLGNGRRMSNWSRVFESWLISDYLKENNNKAPTSYEYNVKPMTTSHVVTDPHLARSKGANPHVAKAALDGIFKGLKQKGLHRGSRATGA